MTKKNVYMCLTCGEWFDTKSELKDHKCERHLDRDGNVVWGKKKMARDVYKEERRELGERLKELGKIQKRSEINFTDIDELREMVEDAEKELENTEG
jgi:predicted S18 family serine protease